MIARLALLLPNEKVHRRTRGSVYTLEEVDTDGNTVRNLFAGFLAKARAWNVPHQPAQLLEIRQLLTRFEQKGPPGLPGMREEGDALALPQHRYEGWEEDVPIELQPNLEDLVEFPALRLYACRLGANLVVVDGNIKRTRFVSDDGSGVLAEFNLANRIAQTLGPLHQAGRLPIDGRTRRLDLERLGVFELREPR